MSVREDYVSPAQVAEIRGVVSKLRKLRGETKHNPWAQKYLSAAENSLAIFLGDLTVDLS